MKTTNILKILTVSISALLSTACSHVDDNKNAIVIQDQSASSIITNLRHLNINQSRADVDEKL